MRKTLLAVLAITGSAGTAAFAADREIKVDDRLDASADTLTDMMRASDQGIPQDLLDKARCVVVVPGMKKAGFIFGVKYGCGFAVCRRRGGSGWSAPAAMRVEGGSVGLQIGASETDIVLLVTNDGGMKHLLSDKFTVGGEAQLWQTICRRPAETSSSFAESTRESGTPRPRKPVIGCQPDNLRPAGTAVGSSACYVPVFLHGAGKKSPPLLSRRRRRSAGFSFRRIDPHRLFTPPFSILFSD